MPDSASNSEWSPSTAPVTPEDFQACPVLVLHYWATWDLVDREMDKRIGRTRLVPSRMIRLWAAALIGAMIPWAYKIVMDRGAQILSTHQTVVHSKLIAVVLLGVYGLTYLVITAALGIPEARNVIDRGKRLLRLPFRTR